MKAQRSPGDVAGLFFVARCASPLAFLWLLSCCWAVEIDAFVTSTSSTPSLRSIFRSLVGSTPAETSSSPKCRIRRLEMSTNSGHHRSPRTLGSSDTASQHFSSRQVASRKTQLRWISQTVQKIQARDISGGVNATGVNVPFQRDALACNAQVVRALSLLSAARTQQQVVEAGRLLEQTDLCRTQPRAVLERVVKAAAMTGLLQLALTVTEHMLQSNRVDDVAGVPTSVEPYLPSEICQDALCNALRRAGRMQRLELLLCQFGAAAQADSSEPRRRISLVSFNTYLAALCDVALRKDVATTQQQQQGSDRVLLGYDTPVRSSKGLTSNSDKSIEALDRAWHWIRDPAYTSDVMAVTPDVVSYATVMQAAAAVGNQTLVEAIWSEIRTRKMSPNIVSYNARLRCIAMGGSSDTTTTSDRNRRINHSSSVDAIRSNHEKNDQKIISIWDDEISNDSAVRPDKYTIDLLLLPFIRAGRVGDVEALLDGFVKRNSEKVVSEAFTAFLITVVGGGELATARALFETYILPTLSPVIVGAVGGTMRIVRPTSRHFNVLLEGYRKQAQSGQLVDESEGNDLSASAMEAWTLYRTMMQSWGARPDAFTITSMMGLCQTSKELSNLLVEAIADLDIECSSVFLRAALTAYGDVGDAESALWLFSKFPAKSTRTWNVLLGSLAKVAENNAVSPVEPMSSTAARAFAPRTMEICFDNKEITELQCGSTLMDVIMFALNAMCESNVATKPNGPLIAPAADSQTFCVASAALQYTPTAGATLATELFRNATRYGVQADGRFLNAMLRCFGTDIDAALALWKDEVRPQCVTFEKSMMGRASGKNLVASYNGLFYVCGRADRPDIALRLVYAMKRDQFEPTEASLNSYRSGQRRRAPKSGDDASDGGFGSVLERKLYESLLFVECTKYDRNDIRRAGEKRVRIIL